MQCEKFERRLDEVLDRRGRPEHDSQLRAHAEVCPACRQLLDAQQALLAELARWDAPQPPGDFAAKVARAAAKHNAECGMRNAALEDFPTSLSVSRCLTKSAASARRRPARTFLTWAAVAAALLMLTPAVYWALRSSSEANRGSPDVVHQTDPDAPAVVHHAPAPASFEAMNPATEAASLAQATVPTDAKVDREERYAQLLQQWQTRLPQIGDTLGLTDAGAPTVQGAAAVSQLTNRLRSPLSASLESTLNVLRTALPIEKQDPAKPQAGLLALERGAWA